MICRLRGMLVRAGPETVELEVAGIGYELMVSGTTLRALEAFGGAEVTLHTVQYFEGNPAGAHLVPRLIGFATTEERAFFHLFTRVKGISNRRALRAMSVAVPQLAAAIESGDLRVLTALPEIGKKTAQQIISELQGQCAVFTTATGEMVRGPTELTAPQRVALEILVQWGDRRADAQRWVTAAVEEDPGLTEPDAIVRAAYRVKTAGV
jgi:Holliday junction DNA helicase RuvA